MKTAKSELTSLKKKRKMSEGDRIIQMQDKILSYKEENKRLQKKVRDLKQQ